MLKADACRIDIQPLIALARCLLRDPFLLSLSGHETRKTTRIEFPSARAAWGWVDGSILPVLVGAVRREIHL
jgi:hypothetical protein